MATLSCSWCGGLRESTREFTWISHESRPGIEYNPNSDITSSTVCPTCTERLAEEMKEFLALLGPGMSGAVEVFDDDELARRMILMIDLINSEPPERDWEDTRP